MPPTPTKPFHKAARHARNPYARPAPALTQGVLPPVIGTISKKHKKEKKEQEMKEQSSTPSEPLSEREAPQSDTKKMKKKRRKEKSRSKSLGGELGSQPVDVPEPAILDKLSDDTDGRENEVFQRLMKVRAASPSLTSSNAPHIPPTSSATLNPGISSTKPDKEKAQLRAIKAQKELARAREEANRREEVRLQLEKAQEEVTKAKAEARKVKEDAEKKEEEMKKRLAELEEAVREGKKDSETDQTIIKEHENTRRDIVEAVTCPVCFEVFKDPHILSCGHTACRSCLQQWFRTPSAYVHEPLVDITDDTDLSHRSKECHTCRARILRRPARAFFLRTIMEPLGLPINIPSGSQDQVDPWNNIFPIEQETYRLYDEQDCIWRCPSCTAEIVGGICQGCALEFSDVEDDEDEDDWSEQDEVGSVLEELGLGVGEESGDSLDSDNDDVVNHTPDGSRGSAGSRRSREDSANDIDGRALDNRSRRVARGTSAVLDALLRGIDDEASDDGNDRSESNDRSLSPLGSEESYEDSFIDDDSVREEDSVDVDIAMDSGSENERQASDEDAENALELAESGLRPRQRGGVPPRVRRQASEEEESPVVMHRFPRRTRRAVRSSDSE
ncbi:hypothetical protein IAR55_004601 [Kwoniella newhampshirensis]|uniref:RING-type domain-containing protein n=1 Tax=Kwoniella newhampshirensis TaxID=1651941 RepID=A0AAW0YY58_9TREE